MSGLMNFTPSVARRNDLDGLGNTLHGLFPPPRPFPNPDALTTRTIGTVSVTMTNRNWARFDRGYSVSEVFTFRKGDAS